MLNNSSSCSSTSSTSSTPIMLNSSSSCSSTSSTYLYSTTLSSRPPTPSLDYKFNIMMPKPGNFLLANDWVWSFNINYDNRVKKNEIIKLSKFSTINDFWAIQNNIKSPSECFKNEKIRYYVFRDDNNDFRENVLDIGKYENGFLQFYIKDKNKCWEDILLLMIGEDLEDSVHTDDELSNKDINSSIYKYKYICGVEIHPDRNRILLWTKDPQDVVRIERLCNFLQNKFSDNSLVQNFSALYFDIQKPNYPKCEMKSGNFIINQENL